MNNITFRQFMTAYNFRYINETEWGKTVSDIYNEDTQIIRIYPPMKDEYDTDFRFSWFEFGIYDFTNKRVVLKKLEKILSKEIMNSYVQTISYSPESQHVVTIYLTYDKGYKD